MPTIVDLYARDVTGVAEALRRFERRKLIIRVAAISIIITCAVVYVAI